MLYLAATAYVEKRRDARRYQISIVVAVAVVALLAFYWALLRFYPVPGFGAGNLGSLRNAGSYFDRSIFGIPHLWPYGTTPGNGVTFDPEGLLSTLPALATLLLGVLAGEWRLASMTAKKKAITIAIAGAVFLLMGLCLSPWMPRIKKIWTTTIARFSGDVALLVYALLYLLLDIKQWKRWCTPALVFGTNAILAFTLSGILTTLTDRIHIAGGDRTNNTLHQWAYLQLFASWLSPIHASLAYALIIVAINLALIYPLYRRRIFLRL
jgi:predicted acyltransferase